MGDPAHFINGQASVPKSHSVDKRCMYHFHSCIEILMRLYEIFKSGKKQDLTPFCLLRIESFCFTLTESQDILKKIYFFVRVKKISCIKKFYF